MRRLLVIEDSTENKISYYHIAAFLITLPFDRLYSELVLISFLLHTLIHLNKQKLQNAFTRQNLLVSSVFFIAAIGVLYSHDKSTGVRDLQRQLAIVLFPLLLSISGIDLHKYRIRLLRLFAFACVCVILYLYIDAIRVIHHNHLPLSYLFKQSFLNHNFSNPIGIHATYLSMFCLLSATVFLYLYLKVSNRSRRIVYFFSMTILLTGLLQLASRSVLISSIIIAPCFPFLMLKGTKRLDFIASLAVIFAFLLLTIFSITSLKTRYVALFKDDLAQASINNEILEPRITRWGHIIELIKAKPLTGYGSGSEKRVVKEAYFKNRLYNSYLHELNAHNQYMSIALKTGVWGLGIFFVTLVAGFIMAFRKKDILFLSFMTIISIVSFSENILDVNKGIFFYACFFSLFIHSGKPFERLLRFKKRQDFNNYSRPANRKENAAIISSDNYV
jgi:O-antigen ligase